MTASARAKLRFVAGFTLFFVGLWLLWNTPVVYPLKIFVVLLHEVSHAIAAVSTGGVLDQITLDPYQGGATYFRGGNPFIAATAGYLGSLLWGALLFAAARTRGIRSDWVNGMIGVSVILLTLAFVRGPFGIAFGILFGVAMVVASREISRDMNRHLLWTLGLTSVLYAILDIKSDVLDRPELQSDAAVIGEMLGVSTWWVGAAWIAVALALAGALIAWAYREA